MEKEGTFLSFHVLVSHEIPDSFNCSLKQFYIQADHRPSTVPIAQATLLAFLMMILGGRQSEREPCELDLKTRAVRLPVIKAVSCKIK